MLFGHTSAPSEVDPPVPPRCKLIESGKVKDCSTCLPIHENTIRRRMHELSPEAIMDDMILKAHRDMFMIQLRRAQSLLECSRYNEQIPSMNMMV